MGAKPRPKILHMKGQFPLWVSYLICKILVGFQVESTISLESGGRVAYIIERQNSYLATPGHIHDSILKWRTHMYPPINV
jgi:hypothetical protein